MSATAKKDVAGAWCTVRCACGQSCGQYLKHYEIVRCDCGKMYWALQPKRGGDFVLFKWPGMPGMAVPP